MVLGKRAEDGDEEEIEEQLNVSCVLALVVPKVVSVRVLDQVAEDWEVLFETTMKDLGFLGSRVVLFGRRRVHVGVVVVSHGEGKANTLAGWVVYASMPRETIAGSAWQVGHLGKYMAQRSEDVTGDVHFSLIPRSGLREVLIPMIHQETAKMHWLCQHTVVHAVRVRTYNV